MSSHMVNRRFLQIIIVIKFSKLFGIFKLINTEMLLRVYRLNDPVYQYDSKPMLANLQGCTLQIFG